MILAVRHFALDTDALHHKVLGKHIFDVCIHLSN